ncbi:hypothetical protein [Brevibacillus massiliensis]|uniref:hypothetical protein n=2 Tax=Brevibacillus massiliensis TaxID=1118054 RepID=UPI0002DB034C|nr:hypothetical protein [Brevibacillus massiliensis]
MSRTFRDVMKEERGSALLSSLFFFLCIAGFLSLLLFVEQADLAEMKTQQTADLISKGARSAGEWTTIDEKGREKKVLIATTEEAKSLQADIVRGAREEAELLYRLNQAGLQSGSGKVAVVHQKGEVQSLYRQGIYHVTIETTKQVQLLWDSIRLSFRRVSQSGLYD